MEHDEQIFRLNKRIKELIAIYEKTLAQNVQIDSEQDRLSSSLAASNEQLKRAFQLNEQYKHELDKLNVDRDQQQKVQHQLKIKLNETMSICRQQNNEIATLKRSLQTQRAISMVPGNSSSRPAVQSAPVVVESSAIEDPSAVEECKRLQAEVRQLEDELQESYELIDDLEFEVEQIAHLEAENQRLQEELNILQSASSIAAPLPAADAHSPVHTDRLEGIPPHRRQPSRVQTSRMHATAVEDVGDDDGHGEDDANADDGTDVVDDKPKPPVDDADYRREMLHRKLESLQVRQSRRSECLTEKFQRGLSLRRQ